jgi:hypothetical protein
MDYKGLEKDEIEGHEEANGRKKKCASQNLFLFRIDINLKKNENEKIIDRSGKGNGNSRDLRIPTRQDRLAASYHTRRNPVVEMLDGKICRVDEAYRGNDKKEDEESFRD